MPFFPWNGRVGRLGSGPWRGGGGAPALLQPGKAVLNLGGGDFNASTFINILKAALFNFNDNNDAGALDSDGYVVSTPANTVFLAWPNNSTFVNTTYKLVWPATRSTWTWNINSGLITKIDSSNATIVGGTGANMTVTATPGQAGWVTFNVGSISAFVIQIGVTGKTYAPGSGEIALYRLSDEADYLAGEYFTPEFKALVSALRPSAIRPMGWVNSGGNAPSGSNNLNFETTWDYRITLGNLSWRTQPSHPLTWGGTVSGTDTYTISPASGSPANWTDGEVIQGVVTSANTSTTPTLSIAGHTGSKTIVTTSGGVLSVGLMTAGALATFVYDGLLDKVLYTSGVLKQSTPIEVMTHLANRVRSSLWATIPTMASDDYVTQWATAALNTLSPDLYFYPEYSNEIWNFSFPATSWAGARGQALGFTSANNQHVFDWYGLRVRQIMGNLIPAVWASRMSKLRRTLMNQAAGGTTTLTYRMKGYDLAPLGTSTGQGNALYSSFTGGADYTSIPNRPVDCVEVIGYAPYAGGTNLRFGPDMGAPAPTAISTSFYQALVNAWESGDSASAVAIIDADIRGGLNSAQTVIWDAANSRFQTPSDHGMAAGSNIAFTVSGGTGFSGLKIGAVYRINSVPTSNTFTMQAYGSTNTATGPSVNPGSAGTGTVSVGKMGDINYNAQTMQALCSNWYSFGEWLASQLDGDRPSGMAALRVEQYEGALELSGPSAAQLTTLGVTGTSPAVSIANAIEAWKNDPAAAATMVTYYNQFMGLDSSMPTFGNQLHSKAPAHLVLQQASGVYGLVNGLIPNNSNYKLYDGFKQFSAPS